jgi:hypothetical protein
MLLVCFSLKTRIDSSPSTGIVQSSVYNRDGKAMVYYCVFGHYGYVPVQVQVQVQQRYFVVRFCDGQRYPFERNIIHRAGSIPLYCITQY